MIVSQWGLFEYTPYIAVIFDLFIVYKTIEIIYYKSLE